MKIFLSFLQGYEYYNVPAYGFWKSYIKNGIEEAGHVWDECSDVDWALGLTLSNSELKAWKDKVWSKTIEHLKASPADLFLSYLYPRQINVQAIEEIKKIGIPCVNFFCDNFREFEEPPTEFKPFNLNWVPEFESIKTYKQSNFNYIHLPMPMWIKPAYRNIDINEQNQVAFIGSADAQRITLLNKVAPLIDDLAVYGKGWQKGTNTSLKKEGRMTNKAVNQVKFLAKFGICQYKEKLRQRNNQDAPNADLQSCVRGSVDFESYIQVTRESIVTLGINRFPSYRFPFSKPGTYSRLRDIEAPMLGACYLTEWTAGIAELYDTSNEILTYTDDASLIGQVDRLKADPLLRTTLRRNGQRRALSAHSVSQSLHRIFSRLG